MRKKSGSIVLGMIGAIFYSYTTGLWADTPAGGEGSVPVQVFEANTNEKNFGSIPADLAVLAGKKEAATASPEMSQSTHGDPAPERGSLPSGAGESNSKGVTQNPATEVSDGSAQFLTSLQGQVGQLEQELVLFRQQTDNRMTDLSARENQLEQELDRFKEVLMLMNQTLGQLEKLRDVQSQRGEDFFNHKKEQPRLQANSLLNKLSLVPWRVTAEYKILSWGVWIIVWGLIILLGYRFMRIKYLSFLTLLIPRYKKKRSELDSKDWTDHLQDSQEDLNKLNTPTSKFTLVRTYLSMGDYPAAQRLLESILNQGNQDEQKKAADLLKTFPLGPQ